MLRSYGHFVNCFALMDIGQLVNGFAPMDSLSMLDPLTPLEILFNLNRSVYSQGCGPGLKLTGSDPAWQIRKLDQEPTFLTKGIRIRPERFTYLMP